MKKFAFLSIIALGLGMVSCDDFTYPNPPAQSNPQEPVYESANLKLNSVVAADVDLSQANAENKAVALAELVSAEGLPEDYTLSFVGQMSGDENFGDAQDFNVDFDGKTISASADDLDAVFHSVFATVDPAARNAYIRFKAYAETEDAPTSRLGGIDAYFCSLTTSMTPFDPGFEVEDTYYLIFSADAETWKKDEAIQFNHGSASPYDDPSFSVVCYFTAEQVGDGLYWKVIPQTTYDSFDLTNGVVFGVTEEDSEKRSGSLDRSADQLAGYYDLADYVMFDVNMRDLTFSYKKVIKSFWIAGDNVNGLSWTFADQPTMWTNNYVDYAGFANLGNEFKFSPTNGWNGDFGSDGGLTFEPTDDGQLIGKGEAVGSKNINVAEPGFYYISLNYSNKALQIVKITSFGIIGGFNGWSESVEMEASEDNMVYTLTADLNAGDEWKFRANNQWTVSLGGALDNLSPFNGDNLKCEETGTYDIRLDLSTLPWTATVVKK